VREALQRLQDEDLVVTQANKWTRVAEIEIEAVDHLLPIMRCLEELALSLAFPSLRPRDLQAMAGANRRLKEALLVGDFFQAAEANRNFHNLFIQRSLNPELTRLTQGIRLKIQRLGSFYFGSSILMPSASIDEHEELIAAIKKGDERRSLAILARHWDNVAVRLRDAAQRERPPGAAG
jgi:DNA-binding GntR family transcriptional regulator